MNRDVAACPICRESTQSRELTVRSGKSLRALHCATCNFDFFDADPTAGLAANKLDQTRLQAAGLDIPKIEEDFQNGLRQSIPLIREYLDVSDQGKNVLEIGCSWGYFLKSAMQAGAIPYGVELNSERARYVNEVLSIPCDESLDNCAARGIRFKKIFLFYVLEYVPQPLRYLQRLIDLLDNDGSLIMLTPNLVDPLKDLWKNPGFTRFFYDEHAINYFSPGAMRRLTEQLPATKGSITTRQGYSFVNHISWHLTNAPRTTGVVGGDNYVRDIVATLKGPPAGTLQPKEEHELVRVANELAEQIQVFDQSYREILEKNDLGNQIHVVVRRA